MTPMVAKMTNRLMKTADEASHPSLCRVRICPMRQPEIAQTITQTMKHRLNLDSWLIDWPLLRTMSATFRKNWND